jgi:hypothetical protein
MKLEHILDGIHFSVSRRWYAQLFTAFTRLVLAVGFIPPSYIKIMHRSFTVLPDSNPVGHYFNALYQTGFYYEFIGWGQMTAAILLLFPRTAHFGALLFLPIIANIAVLTTSVGFKGTWVLTIFMSLAATWLVAWEYDRLKPILFRSREWRPRALKYQFVTVPLFFCVGGLAMGGLWKLMGLGSFRNYLYVALLLGAFGLIFGVFVSVHYRYMQVGNLKPPGESL